MTPQALRIVPLNPAVSSLTPSPLPVGEGELVRLRGSWAGSG